jgi:TolA-binding protein
MRRQLVLIAACGFFSLMTFAKPAPVKDDTMSKENLLIELTGKDYKKIKEEDLYAEVITAYKSGNDIALKARSQTFLKRFPQSQFADNVIYLSGLLALQNHGYPEALRQFQKVIKFYPNSNKAVSAQFSKAITYKRLNLDAEAKRVFKEVMVKYPGSPESFRAEAELKLLN